MPKLFDSRLSPADAKRRFGSMKANQQLRAGLDRSEGYDVLVTLLLSDGQPTASGRYRRDGRTQVLTYGIDAIAPLADVESTRDPHQPKTEGITPESWSLQWEEHRKLVEAVRSARIARERAEEHAKRQAAFARGEEILVLSGYAGQLFEDKDGLIAKLSSSECVRVCCTLEGARIIDNRIGGRSPTGHSKNCVHFTASPSW